MAFNGQLAKLVQGRRSVIPDGFYKMPPATDHLFDVLGRESVFFVQLYCDLPELERREEARGNRGIGLAQSQFEQMYSFQGYDLLIDSTWLSVEDCAQKLIEEVPNQSLQGTL
jgi:chloramphenicol 3-O phosphotransferase